MYTNPFKTLLVFFLTFTTSFSVFADTETVALTGAFRVNEMGAATYSLPIDAAPGRGGMKPSVAIAYSSSGSDGYLGLGWGIQAASAINRCPKTIEQDGFLQGVQLTDTDSFCLDGQRLILVSGQNGTDGAEYRKEIDDASLITVLGRANGGGPGAFKVETKAGETFYYGDVYTQAGKNFVTTSNSNNQSDSYQTALKNGNEVIHAWSLKAIEDVVGNYISYHYFKTNDEQYLSSIDYSGHNNGALPYKKISFDYGARPYPKKGIVYGSAVSQTKLLNKIVLSTDNQIEQTYYLTYKLATSLAEFNYLDSIQACVGTNNTDCTSAIQFDWERSGAPQSPTYRPYTGILPAKNLNIPSGENLTANIFDMDGDGLADIVYVRNGTWYKRSIASGVETQMTSIGASQHAYAQTIDFDGDGQRDLLIAANNTSPWQVLSFKPSQENTHDCEPDGNGGQLCTDSTRTVQYTQTSLGQTAVGLNGSAMVADVNGDALEDIVFLDAGQIKWYKNLGGGSFAAAASLFTFPTGSDASPGIPRINHSAKGFESSALLDVNGDGLTDLLLKVKKTVNYCSTGSGIIYDITQSECIGDFNGRWGQNITDNWILYVSTGSGYKEQQIITIVSGMDTLRAADFNGDGLTDIAYVKSNQWYIQLSDSNGFLAPIATGIATDNDKKLNTYFVDISGNGRADILAKSESLQSTIYMSEPSSVNGASSWKASGIIDHVSNLRLFFADIDGIGKLDIIANASGWFRYAPLSPKYNNTIKAITDGFGVTTMINYAYLTEQVNGQSRVYKTQTSSNVDHSKNFSIIAPLQVVAEVSTQASSTGSVSVAYEYGGLLVNRLGRGVAGFELLRTIDNQSKVVTETMYDQIFPRIGLPIASKQSYQSQALSEARTSVDFVRDSYGVYRQTSMSSTDITRQYGTDNVVRELTQVDTQNTYDDAGNILSSEVVTRDLQTNTVVSTVSIINEYNGAGGGASKGRLSHSVVTKSRAGQRDNVPDITNESSFTYFDNGLIKDSIVSPNDNRYKVTTSVTYDVYGNKTSESITAGTKADGSEPQTRSNYSTYDARGRYLKTSINPLGDTATYGYNGTTADSVTGLITKVTLTDANGRKLTKTSDRWGRPISELTPDGVATQLSYQRCSSVGCPQFYDGYLLTTKSKTGTPTESVVSDKYGRTVGSLLIGFDGTVIVGGRKEYDGWGRPVRDYEPRYGSVSTYFTELRYDGFGRVVAQVNPNRGETLVDFLGFETLTIDPLGNQTSVVVDALGLQSVVTDALNNQLHFVYDASGNLLKSYVSGNGTEIVRTQLVYDDYGRKTTSIDVDKGTWRYTYNAFGELLSQTNGNNQSTFFYYDTLGRQVRQTEPEGASCWVYGTKAAKNAGLLVAEKRYDTIVSDCSAAGAVHQKTTNYDELGRLKSTTTTIGASSYTSIVNYDTLGRVSEQIYPENLLTVVNHYNTSGYLYKRTDKATGKAYQTIEKMNAKGGVEKVIYGNGTEELTAYDEALGWVSNIQLKNAGGMLHDLEYVFDGVGNLTYRKHQLSSASTTFAETYTYDDLYRLYDRTINITSGGVSLPNGFKLTQSTRYDDFGNITSKTGVGTYRYDATNPYRLLDICGEEGCGTLETTPASKSCPTGYALNAAGTTCQKSESQSASLSYNYSCPSGYSLSGTTCSKTETKVAQIKTEQTCPKGGYLNASTGTCSRDFTIVSATKPSGAGVVCGGGEPMGGGRRLWECTETYKATSSQVYSCDAGWTVSGTNCTRTLSQAATQIPVYSCPAGWSVSGAACNRTLTASITYSCPVGWTQNGAQCSRARQASYAMVYDKNGNITNDGTRTLTYSSYDLVTNIAKGNESSRFKYDASRQRYERYDVKLEDGVLAYYTTYYIDGAYEKVVRTGGGKAALTEQKLYVGNLVITKRSNNSTDSFLYLHKDHQGSTTTITDGDGKSLQQFVYDPWGKQTAVFDTGLLANYTTPATTKGYTGHEHISHLDLIHMNGRIYDATIGRFMQADPFIQAPSDTQSYNRYSYVKNNPMSYTDPSGFFLDKLWKGIKKYWRVAVAIVATVYLGPLAAQLWGPVIGGAATGFVAGGIATGSLKGALVGAATGAMFGAIGDYFQNTQGFSVGKIASHGVAGGISSELSGGKFGHGFASAGFTQLAGQMGVLPDIGANSAQNRFDNAIAAAVVGGTASVLSGGKFANGAVTGMFSRMLNDSLHAKPNIGQKNKLSTWYRRGEKYASEGDMADSLGVEGKTVIVFGKRGLDNFFMGVEGPVSDFLNHEAIHEHAFAIQDNRVTNLGFSRNGLGPDNNINFTGFGYSSYAFTDYYILPGNVDIRALLNNVPGNWMPYDYVIAGPTVNNCQSYADSLRRQIEVTYGPKK
ncbi:FG-GAP-like repeat-containing protein [Shewanella sp. CG12_big_fil_rev_8_21_14_0_65_47_15]|uniref:FG-GAP-like repeat-containing protein n=1 Tax=Shewanella sp. CG12_big_fil_rev_8_21_14_0_65_47_15 TaxID=1975537 RepID=UPI0025F2A829|nr:FG-GAP-like repeat-containing protein [Shewanella sp. CG12_big_fil_rev_8_21_14_0_65_47_15]